MGLGAMLAQQVGVGGGGSGAGLWGLQAGWLAQLDVIDGVTRGALAQAEVGGYVSIWKIVPFLVALLVWARLLTWVDKDAEAAHLPRQPLNAAVFGTGVLGLVLFFFMPIGFPLAFGAMVIVMAIGVGVYLGMRHQKVGLGDLKDTFIDFVRGMFTRKPREVKAAKGQVLLYNKQGAAQAPPAAEDPNAEAFGAVQQILTDPLLKEAERIDVAPGEGVANVKFSVDGVSYSGGQINRQAATAAVTYLKALAGMDLNEKRKPQKGNMKVSIDGPKKEVQITTAGSAQGEFMAMLIEPKKRHALRLEGLGMADDQLEVLRGSIQDNSGIVLVAAPKTQGLTTLLYAILRGHDAFLTHIHTIERGIDEDLEGITQNKISASASPAEEYKQVSWVCSQEPEVLMVTELHSPESARELAKFAQGGKRVYVGIRAGNTFEALTAWRKLVGDDDLATGHLSMVIAGRVVRRLCAACKVGYTPEPTTLRKLNMDPDKIAKLYQARTEPLRDSRGNPVPCEFCKELRFKGRIGVYELLTVDDEARAVIQQGGSLNQLKAIFRKQRSRYLQEQALQLVEAGETSIQEVLRVMKDTAQPAAAAAGAPAGRPPAA